jgi:nitroimidazol reductase NimA-like FMN-containing flavoprotein (pyridoxamine 5'-phosphate oxidase superfamily)
MNRGREGTMRELGTDRAGLEMLHLGDCFGLLASALVGRIAFAAGGEVVILPVTFLVDGQDVVFSAAAGSKLATVEVGQYAGFEADCYDRATRSGWSVVINGLLELVDSADEATRLDALGLPPWGGAGEQVWVRIRPVTVSGRRIPEEAAEQVNVPTGKTVPGEGRLAAG